MTAREVRVLGLPVRHLAWLIVLVVGWLALVQLFHRGSIVTSDEINYTLQAQRFADHGSLDAGSFYFRSLLTQDPPLRAVHTPGYSMLLGGFFWITGIDAADLAAHATLPSFLNYLLLAGVAIALFLVLRRLCRSPLIPWLGTAVFMTFPLINQTATTAMAETTVLAAVVAVVLMLFGGGDDPSPSSAATIGAAVVLAFGILVRPSLILMLPVLVIVLWRSAGRRDALVFGVTVLALMPLVMWLSSNRVKASGSTLGRVLGALRADPIDGVRVTAENLWSNIVAFFTWFKGVGYSITKVLFWGLAGLMVASAALARVRRLPLAQAVIGAFVLNTAALFATYDVHHWRGLRVSIQFVPLAVLVLAIAADGLGSVGRRRAVVSMALFAAVCLAATAITVSERNDVTSSETAGQATAIAAAEACFEGEGPVETVLIDSAAAGIRILHPDVDWVLPSERAGEVSPKSVAVVEAKLGGFDCVVAGKRWAFDPSVLGLEEVEGSSGLRVFRRSDPTG